jgi:hypothetical protein
LASADHIRQITAGPSISAKTSLPSSFLLVTMDLSTQAVPSFQQNQSRTEGAKMGQTNKSSSDEKLLAQKAKGVDLVDYRASSIVSRTILEKNTGTVTLFAFDAGQGLSEHTAPYDALVCILCLPLMKDKD